MQQGRWVSYIYRYRNNVKCENAGFIKGQRVSSGQYGTSSVRFQIGLKLYKKKACKCTVYLLYDKDKAEYLTDIYLAAEERDVIMTRIELPWDDPLRDGRDIEVYDGLFFRCGDGEALTGLWNEYPVNPDQIIIMDKQRVQGNGPKPSEPVYGQAGLSDEILTEEVPVEEASVEEVPVEEASVEEASGGEVPVETALSDEAPVDGILADGALPDEASAETASADKAGADELPFDVCRNILNTYPKLPLFADSQFIECVKIVPHDIGKLAISNWKLGVNSFVSHGYYHYRYLMLGRVRFDTGECVVIGVPGVFTNKEKYLANMFGFDMFIPVKRVKTLTGNFGYWVSEVLRE